MYEVITTRVNKNILLSELKNGIRFGTDSLLLAYFAGKHKKGFDLGCGSGIISLLLLSLGKVQNMTGMDILEEYVSIAAKNAEINRMSHVFEAFEADVADISTKFKGDCADMVCTNPPYLKNNEGKTNLHREKFIAFHETTAGLDEFLKAASYLLKTGGSFYASYRPEYLAKLLCSMTKNDIECKSLRFVYPSPGKKPSIILVKGKKHGAVGMKIENPLYIYKDNEHKIYTDEMEGIYRDFD